MADAVLKVRKLLSLSKNATGAEAETALVKAQEIALKYNLDLAVISVQDQVNTEEEEFTNEKVELGKKKNPIQRFVSMILMDHFNVDVVYSGSRYTGMNIVFLGRKSDVQVALHLQDYLLREFYSRWTYYKKTTQAKVKDRNSFYYGLWRGLNNKLHESKEAVEEDIFKGLEPDLREKTREKYSLIKLNDTQLRRKYVESVFPVLTRTPNSTRRRISQNVVSDGFSQGKSININQPLGNGLYLTQ